MPGIRSLRLCPDCVEIRRTQHGEVVEPLDDYVQRFIVVAAVPNPDEERDKARRAEMAKRPEF